MVDKSKRGHHRVSAEKRSFRDLKISKVSIGDLKPHGELFIRGLSCGAFDTLSKVDQDDNLPASELVTHIIQELVCDSDDRPFSQEKVCALDEDARRRIVRAVIKQNPDWFVEDHNEKGKGIDLAKISAPMEQNEEENDEEFLARGVRAELASQKAFMNTVMSGLSDRMQGVLGPSITANMGASQHLSNLLNNIKPRLPVPSRISEIPRNPIYDTNEILREVTNQIGQMRDLAAATADLHRTLNDTAATAVADFSKGAEKSRTAALYGLWIAGMTLLFSVLALAFSIYTMRSQNAKVEARETAPRAQTERRMATEAEPAKTIGGLSQEKIGIRKETKRELPQK